MSQEEARLLLDAWNYFDSHPKARFWEGLPGISRDEFLRLMPVVTGLESLVEAKIYLGQVATGKLYETVPGTIIEKAQEENLPASSVEDAKRATTAVRVWLKNIKPKSAEDLAFRQVAVAQVKAELARIEEKATPPIPEKAATPSVPEKPTAPTPVAPEPEPLSVGIKITPATGQVLQKFTARVATLPVRAAVAWSRPTLSASEPQRAAALTLWAKGISSERLEEKAAGLEVKERLTELVKAIRNEERIFSVQTQLLRRAFPVKDINFLLGPESGLTQAEVSVFFSPSAPGGFSAAPRRSFFGDIFNRLGQQLFGKVATNFIKGAGQKAIAGVGAKAAVQAAVTGVAAAAGPPGLLVRAAAYLVAELAPRILGWINKHAREIFGSLLVGGGLLLGGGVGLGMALGGGLLFVGGAGLKAAAGNVGNFFSFFFTGVLLPSIGIPILVALISIPVLVAIILFIINSGAYIVPPRADLIAGLVVSPYIDVKKTASPAGPFQNGQLPITVEYTIEVRAKKGALTNVRFEYSCEVIREKSSPACPQPNPAIPTGEDIPQIISPTESFSFTYKQTYQGSSFTDSLVIDTFTVIADAAEQAGAKAAGSASIVIGNPPQDCPNGWPVASGAITQGPYTSFTHSGTEAIDIGGVGVGTTITARHSGIARVTDAWPYGKNVEIDSSCNGKSFFSRYSHLSVISVRTGERITLGGVVGLTGNTGKTTGAHLHYEFRYPEGPTLFPSKAPYMSTPFVPKSIPRGCDGAGNCKTGIP